ncbi:MAG: hypothetical protein JNM68_05040 [Dinghuibacter sp.]|nr:hypothetical protein [Dinghuibacter sp.]
MPGIKSNHIVAVIVGLLLGGISFFLLVAIFLNMAVEAESGFVLVALFIILLGVCCFITGYATLSITRTGERGMKTAIAIICALVPWGLFWYFGSVYGFREDYFSNKGWYTILLQSLGAFTGGWLGASKVIYNRRKA